MMIGLPSFKPLPGLAALAVAVLVLGAVHASARGGRDHEGETLRRPAGTPLLAVVALHEQRVTIFDAEGKILRAPVSTGQTGYETPAGIYSVIQKEAEHFSNLYDDAEMPFMQRITWSGIALHAGVLPGHPASHGCIRMPYAFAEHLFELTKLGMRVLVVPRDVAPADFVHPLLFKPRPIDEAAVATGEASGPEPMHLSGGSPALPPHRPLTLKSIADARAAEAEDAERKAEQARAAAVRAAAAALRFKKAVRMAEAVVQRTQAQLQEAERAAETASSLQVVAHAEEAKSKLNTRLEQAQAALSAAQAEGEPTIDAAAAARETVKAADAVRIAALAAAREAAAKLKPVSVYISRATQRLYVRQSFQPLFDIPISIDDSEAPIGTHVFTALDYIKEGADVRWSAVTISSSEHAGTSRGRRRDQGEPAATDASRARAALDRIGIPEEARNRISEVVSPGSSLIVSDEPLSKETSKGTDFIVLMSGEPQGGIKMRRHNSLGYDGYGRFSRPWTRAPYRTPYSWW
jgi:L,D-transpeptidase catalytic domain